jgi:hypothetical protein
MSIGCEIFGGTMSYWRLLIELLLLVAASLAAVAGAWHFIEHPVALGLIAIAALAPAIALAATARRRRQAKLLKWLDELALAPAITFDECAHLARQRRNCEPLATALEEKFLEACERLVRGRSEGIHEQAMLEAALGLPDSSAGAQRGQD